MKRIICSFAVILLLASAAFCQPVDLGSEKHLFIDKMLFEDSTGVRLRVNPPEKEGVVIDTDRPWNDGRINYASIVFDGEKYRCYYTSYADGKDGKFNQYLFCMATSQDGIKWERPSLGLYNYNGSKDNNIISHLGGHVFINPEAGPERRYVLINTEQYFGDKEKGGIRLAHSPDGLHWTWEEQRLLPFGCDTWNIAHYDPNIDKIAFYLRSWIPGSFAPGDKRPRRTVSRIAIEPDKLYDPWVDEAEITKDSWSYPAWTGMLTLTDELPVVLKLDENDPPYSDIYSPGIEIYPYGDNVYLAFFGTYQHWLPEGMSDGPGDIQLAVSRDGIHFTRPERKPYIDLGLRQPREQDAGFLSYAPGMIRDGAFLYQYYTANKGTHAEYLRLKDMTGGSKMMRVRQRLDGFVSADFDYQGGTLTTRPVYFEGEQLQLNIDCSAMGSGRVELRDEDNNPIKGYTLEDCDRIYLNYIAKTVTWNGSPTLTDIPQPVRIHFEFNDTKLFALQFVSLTETAQAEPAEDLQLTRDGKSDYVIALSVDCSTSEAYAGRELASFLKEISGAEIPVNTGLDTLPEKAILVGFSDDTEALGIKEDKDRLGQEGFIIRTAGPRLVIAGGRKRGTLYGVYSFLEEQLGCRWYAKDVSRIPKQDTIIIGSLDVLKTPDFEYRDPYFTCARDPDWTVRNKGNGVTANIDEKRGGHLTYGTWAHTFEKILPAEEYLEDHPEYFSLVDGKRVGGQHTGQLCLTNPKVLQIAKKKVLQWIEDHPDSKIFSVSQNDNPYTCQCDKCRAIDAEEGSPSGRVLRFVNAVAQEVAREHPDVLIDTLAYWHTEAAPKITRPRENVRIRLCPIWVCQYHPYNECDHPKNEAFMENFRAWSELTDTLYVWHYCSLFHHVLAPLPDFQQLAANIPFYKEHGVRGIFMEGNDGRGGGGFMDELKAYLTAKLMWDVETDAEKVMADFMQGYFGRAAEPMMAWLDLFEREIERRPDLHGTCWPEKDFDDATGSETPTAYPKLYLPILTDEVLARSEELFSQALEMAQAPEVRSRVEKAHLALEYYDIMTAIEKVAAAGPSDKNQPLFDKYHTFTDKCREFGIGALGIIRPIEKVDQDVRWLLFGEEPAGSDEHS